MNALIIIPVWAAILGAVGIATMVGFPSALLGARYGAKLAVELCAKQQGCAMRVNQERQQTTQNLEEQLAALHKKHPELAKAREAMSRVLKDTGESAAIPDKKG